MDILFTLSFFAMLGLDRGDDTRRSWQVLTECCSNVYISRTEFSPFLVPWDRKKKEKKLAGNVLAVCLSACLSIRTPVNFRVR